MIVAIASGKGGAGKTSLAANLVRSAPEYVLAVDADVEEPNLHLFLNPRIKISKPFLTSKPEICFENCTYCGLCAETCRFNAMAVLDKTVMIFPELCHACGACAMVCPAGAVSEIPQPIGVLKEGEGDGFDFLGGN